MANANEFGTCETCGTALAALATSVYCPNEDRHDRMIPPMTVRLGPDVRDLFGEPILLSQIAGPGRCVDPDLFGYVVGEPDEDGQVYVQIGLDVDKARHDFNPRPRDHGEPDEESDAGTGLLWSDIYNRLLRDGQG